MTFKGIQKTFTYRQINEGNIDEVFPLLCPVREKDWLDGWDYKMIHSNSGLIEKDCVFATPAKNNKEMVWQVTKYDVQKKKIEFLRVTPGENVVKINIHLYEKSQNQTWSEIEYMFTGLNPAQNEYIKTQLHKDFVESMKWWEKSINHYIKTKSLLKKNG